MEFGQGQRGGPALGGADDRVSAGSQALVGGQPVVELTGQEGLPLLATVLLPVGVETVGTAGGRDDRDALAGKGVHRVACRDPVTYGVAGVKRRPAETLRADRRPPAEMVIGPPLATENASGHQRRLRGLERPAATSQTLRVSRWAQIAA